jgi:hypothetical protein
MREQTRRNIMYLAGMEALDRLSTRFGWDATRLDAARAELVRRFRPTLAEV